MCVCVCGGGGKGWENILRACGFRLLFIMYVCMNFTVCPAKVNMWVNMRSKKAARPE